MKRRRKPLSAKRLAEIRAQFDRLEPEYKRSVLVQVYGWMTGVADRSPKSAAVAEFFTAVHECRKETR